MHAGDTEASFYYSAYLLLGSALVGRASYLGGGGANAHLQRCYKTDMARSTSPSGRRQLMQEAATIGDQAAVLRLIDRTCVWSPHSHLHHHRLVLA
jgi:hypothetical protein